MERRSFLKTAAAGGLAAGSIAAPAIVRAQPAIQWRLAASWGAPSNAEHLCSLFEA
jgi:TRAP-type mannitol/chloroaromatic compound transport system substrate-binding protein